MCPQKKSYRSALTSQGKDHNGSLGVKPKTSTCPYPTKEQDWLIGLAKTKEKKKRKEGEERNSCAGGDAVAAPSALCLGGACREEQQKHIARDGVKPICSASSWL